MIRTILMLGLFAMVGLFALKLAFGVFGAFVALMIWLLVLAVKVALIGGIAYLALRLVSPGTARRLRESVSGGGGA
jgi:hypothetical protein